MARYVHVPIVNNNVLKLTEQNLGSPTVDEEGQTDQVVGNNSGSEVGTEGGLDGVGIMVGPEQSKPEPVVSNTVVQGLAIWTHNMAKYLQVQYDEIKDERGTFVHS